ncbi:MAG: aldehyde dehydrogenase family protein [Gemmatimonadota bacterium]|nr:aldehyde dehydrogenase family protein [Gemmatimonadota bacterium]
MRKDSKMADRIETRLLIGGRWLESEKQMPVLNPYTGGEVARVEVAGAGHVEQAVRAAGVSRMSMLTAARRYEILRSTADAIQGEAEGLTRLLVAETGKPWCYAAGEVARTVQTFSFAADEARRLRGRTMELDAHPQGVGHWGFYHRFPLGVIAAVTPFNFPLNLVAHKVAPALAAGNSVVLKPASATPLVALRLARILEQAGLPEGGINVLVGSGSTIGQALVTSEQVRMVTFTGSLEVGRNIRRDAGMKRVTLELGSNSALVIEDEARLEEAVSRCVVGAFAFSGQVCISIQRILLNESLAGRFLEQFIPLVEQIERGDPMEEATQIGPMIEEAEARRIESWIEAAVRGGARVLTGGKREGAFFQPTVLDQVKPDMDIYCKEAFGPVVCIETYRDYEDALDRVNSSVYGLQAGVYTESLEKAMTAFMRLEVGGVNINDYPTFRVDQMPYGGVKGSGTGREGPAFAIEEMTELKLCTIRL